MGKTLTIEQAEFILRMAANHNRTEKLKEIIEQLDPVDRATAVLITWPLTQIPSLDWEFWEEWLPWGFTATEDQEAFDALPDELTIYRGSGSKETAAIGFSWTLDKNIAIKFAEMTTVPIGNCMMVPREQPGFIATAKIPKPTVSLFITDREESEVVLHPERLPYKFAVEPV